jgi:hypothetical protein
MKAPQSWKSTSLFFLFTLFASTSFCFVSNMFFDTTPIYGVNGVNRYPLEGNGKTLVNVSISPFFQHSTGARNKDGIKVPEGDRLGTWSMIGLFWGSGTDGGTPGNAAHKTFNGTNFATVYPLYTHLVENSELTIADLEPKSNGWYGNYTVDIKYEKVGVRTALECEVGSGFGICFKGGIASYKQDPIFTDSSPSSMSAPFDAISNSYLMSDTVRNAIGTDLDLSFDRIHDTAPEDALVQIYWSTPFDYKDKENHLVVTVHPYISIGAWLPSGKKKNQDNLFSLPLGNDGHLGICVEGALNFDFPKMCTVNVGGGASFFNERSIDDFRVPNSRYQSTIYPWKTTIRRRPGTTWNVNLSMKAEHIVDTLTFFCDYVYARHEKDSITVSSTKSEYFIPSKLENESGWKDQAVHCGFSYDLTENLSLGLSGQTHISGEKIYKNQTVMGNASFTF